MEISWLTGEEYPTCPSVTLGKVKPPSQLWICVGVGLCASYCHRRALEFPEVRCKILSTLTASASLTFPLADNDELSTRSPFSRSKIVEDYRHPR